jgi:putative ATPase
MGFGLQEINLDPKALDFLVETADGDARRALGGLEVGVLSSTDRPLVFTEELAREKCAAKSRCIRLGRHSLRLCKCTY